MEPVEGGTAGGQRVDVRVPMSDPKAPEIAESGVVEDDDHDVRSAVRRLGV